MTAPSPSTVPSVIIVRLYVSPSSTEEKTNCVSTRSTGRAAAERSRFQP